MWIWHGIGFKFTHNNSQFALFSSRWRYGSFFTPFLSAISSLFIFLLFSLLQMPMFLLLLLFLWFAYLYVQTLFNQLPFSFICLQDQPQPTFIFPWTMKVTVLPLRRKYGKSFKHYVRMIEKAQTSLPRMTIPFSFPSCLQLWKGIKRSIQECNGMLHCLPFSKTWGTQSCHQLHKGWGQHCPQECEETYSGIYVARGTLSRPTNYQHRWRGKCSDGWL